MNFLEMYDPINDKEKAIKVQLIENGLDEEEIEFYGDDNNRYMRYAYWEKLEPMFIEKTNLIENLFDNPDNDDDYNITIHSPLCSYKIQ